MSAAPLGGPAWLQRGLGIAAEDREWLSMAASTAGSLQRGLGIAAEDRTTVTRVQ